MCPNTELFLVRIFFRLNTGKYGPEITPHFDTSRNKSLPNLSEFKRINYFEAYDFLMISGGIQVLLIHLNLVNIGSKIWR